MTIVQGNILVGLEDGFFTLGAYGALEGACADLGATEGGCELSIPREYYEKMCDQAIGVLDIIKISEKATLKVKLAEATLENLAIAMDYDDSVAVSSSVLSIGGSGVAQYLTIYLNVTGLSGGTRQYHFIKAVCVGAATHSSKRDEKTIIECEFQLIQDTTKTDDQQLFTVTDSASDTTAPSIALTTPSPAGTVAKTTVNPVVLTITETNLMNEGTIIYGDNDGATIGIYDVTDGAVVALKAGSIVYALATKTVTFTPSIAWTTVHKYVAIVTTGLADAAGNHLAATYLGHFTGD
jgi:hypothetical protein